MGVSVCVSVSVSDSPLKKLWRVESDDEAGVNLSRLEYDAVQSFEHHVTPDSKNKTTLCELLHMALGGDTFSSVFFLRADLLWQAKYFIFLWPLMTFRKCLVYKTSMSLLCLYSTT